MSRQISSRLHFLPYAATCQKDVTWSSDRSSGVRTNLPSDTKKFFGSNSCREGAEFGEVNRVEWHEKGGWGVETGLEELSLKRICAFRVWRLKNVIRLFGQENEPASGQSWIHHCCQPGRVRSPSGSAPVLWQKMTEYLVHICLLLWSSTAHLLQRPLVLTSVASRALTVAAPTVWNSPSVNTRSADSFVSFKRRLKTELMASTYAI